MSTKIKHWKDCKDDKNIISFAKQNNVEVREAAGSHFVMSKGNNIMTAYHSNNISTGVAVRVFKWFKTIGLVCVIIGYFVFKNPSCNENNYVNVISSPNGEIIYICT